MEVLKIIMARETRCSIESFRRCYSLFDRLGSSLGVTFFQCLLTIFNRSMLYKCNDPLLFVSLMITLHFDSSTAFLNKNYFECGQYGFICEGSTKLRLCDDNKLFGPSFNCPSNTVCNEESSDVCENTVNYVDPAVSRTLRCHRNERVADPNVPGCKGYILCIPNNNRFQGIKFKCSGDTIFNGITRTCSAPNKYKCPLSDSHLTTPKLFDDHSDKKSEIRNTDIDRTASSSGNRPIDCKNYKFVVTQDRSPVRATFFCPPRPAYGESKIRCTVFSNQFCITLERNDPDQFIENSGTAFRRPRLNNGVYNVYL